MISALGLVTVVVLLLLGGAGLARLLFPDDLSPAARGAGAIGLGLAALIAVGLLADRLGIPLGAGLWAVVLAAGAIASQLVLRPHRAALPRIPAREGALLGLAAVIAVGALAVSRHSATEAAARTRFTQLWLLPRGGAATLGVANHERRRLTYRLRVTGPGGTLLATSVPLADGATWRRAIRLPRTAERQLVRAELFRPGDATPYRRVQAWTG